MKLPKFVKVLEDSVDMLEYEMSNEDKEDCQLPRQLNSACKLHFMGLDGGALSFGLARSNGSCSACTQPTACSILWELCGLGI